MIDIDFHNFEIIIDLSILNINISGRYIDKINIKIKDTSIRTKHNFLIFNNYIINNGSNIDTSLITSIKATKFSITYKNDRTFYHSNTDLILNFKDNKIHNLKDSAILFGYSEYYVINNKLASNLKEYNHLKNIYLRKQKILKCI